MVDRGGIDFSLETAACKVFASELALRAALEAQQVAGGLGYSKEYPYEQAVRDSRIMLIFEGTNEILRALIALSGLQQPGEQLKALGKAFRDPLHSLGAIGSYIGGRVKRTLVKPEFTRVHPALAEEAEMVCKAVHDLALAVEKAPRRARQGRDRAPVPPGAARRRRDRHLPLHGHPVARHLGDRQAREAPRPPWPTSTMRASSSRWPCAARGAPCAPSRGTRRPAEGAGRTGAGERHAHRAHPHRHLTPSGAATFHIPITRPSGSAKSENEPMPGTSCSSTTMVPPASTTRRRYCARSSTAM